jgi:hypothetical protein
MNPFGILLPENWQVIVSFLDHPWDARDAVALQRTCRAAAALFPGAMWGGMWLSSADMDPALRHEHQARAYVMMRTLFRSKVVNESWFQWPEMLTVNVYAGSSVDEDVVRMALVWSLGPGIKMLVIYDRTGIEEDGGDPWEWSIQVAAPTSHDEVVLNLDRRADVLEHCFSALMRKVPLLGFGIDPHRIHEYARQHKLDNLFIVKE